MAITYSDRTEYEGCVLDEGEINGYDDSDFYAVVYDRESDSVKRVTYASTRYAGGGRCTIDATPEAQTLAAEALRRRLFAEWKAHNEDQARVPTEGREVCFVKGRPTVKLADGSRMKVPLGTVGTVQQRQERRSQYGTWSYGFRLAVAVSSETTPAYDLREDGDKLRLVSPYDPNFPRKARALDGDWDRNAREWVFDAARKDEVVALANACYPPTPTKVCWTNADNVEVMDPERYEEPEETGHRYAEAYCRNWRGATANHNLPII